MASIDQNEIAHEFFPLIRHYKDGRIERFIGNDIVPASLDSDTGVRSKDVQISPDHGVSARIYLPGTAAPNQKLPLLVYIHGGGFVVQSAFSQTYHTHLNMLAAEANALVVSVDYRLAPEHPLPAAYEDCWVALKWVAAHSHDGGDEPWLKEFADFQHVFFGGDSAGGNLAHNMAIRVGSNGLEGIKLEGLILTCPYFWGEEPVGNEADRVEVRKFVSGLWLYAHPKTTGVDDPLINPAKDPKLSDLGCKRVIVYVAEKDVLKYRGWYYKEALSESGWVGEAEVVEVEGEDHVFNLFFPNSEKTLSMLKKLASFINK